MRRNKIAFVQRWYYHLWRKSKTIYFWNSGNNKYDFSNVAGYKVDTETSIIFPYVNNEKVNLKLKSQYPEQISMPQNKCLVINLTEHVCGQYKEKYITLMKEMK